MYYDENCTKRLGYSIDFRRKPSFRNAIIQNIAGGNTMLFNNETKDLIVKSLQRNLDIVSHDWWTYILVSGSGGFVHYDKSPLVKYRQHKNNIQGSNNSFKDRFNRILYLFSGRFRLWNNINIKALERNINLLKKENNLIFEKFIKIRDKSFFKRIYYIQDLKIYRQTFIGNIALLMAILFKKI